jgi:hypothetical protein
LRRTDRRGGQLEAHRDFHLMRPAALLARLPGTFLPA